VTRLAVPRRTKRQLVFGTLGLALVVTLAWAGRRLLPRAADDAGGPDWDRPATIAAWAKQDLVHRGVAPDTTTARVETRTSRPRRVVVSHHPDGEPLGAIVRGAARWLLLASQQGAATQTHLVVVRQGDLSASVPLAEASRLAQSRDEVAAWLGIPVEDVPLEEGDPAPSPAEAAALAPVTDAEPLGSTDDAASPVPPPPEPAESAVPEPAETEPVAASGPESAPATATAEPPATTRNRPPTFVRGGPVPRDAKAGQEGVVLLRVQVHPGDPVETRLRSITIKARGSLSDVDALSWVKLVRDVDSDGKPGPADPVLGTESFTDDDGSITFAGLDQVFGAAGASLGLLVTADIADQTEGGSILLSIPGTSSIVLEDVATGAPLVPRSRAVTGTTVKVEGNVEPDPEETRLDALANAGPDAIDDNLDRMRADALAQQAEAQAGAEGGDGKTQDQGQQQQDQAKPGQAPAPAQGVSLVPDPFAHRKK
jgi:hypothetical protein